MKGQCWIVLAACGSLCACVTSGGPGFKKDDEAAASYNLQLGVDYFRQGNLSQAKDKLDRALAQNPRSAEAHMTAGLLYDRLNEPRKADEHFSRALDLDPKNSEILNSYAVFLCRKGDRIKGEKLAIRAATNPLYKTPEAAWLNAGFCAQDAGNKILAEQYFRRALSVQPTFGAALLQMAELELIQGNYLPARGFLERFQQSTKPNPGSLWLGVRIERGLGNGQAMSNYARQLREEFPTSDETKALLEFERKPHS